MKKVYQHLLLLLFVGSLMGCNKKEWDDYYARPEGLGDPIYQQLQARPNFKNLLQCIDKAGYKDILGKTGYWTFFAPTDAAFEKFLAQNNISDISKISDSLATSIVKYCLVYNAYRKDQLEIFQSASKSEDGRGMAFRRKTAYYDWIQKGQGTYAKWINTNRNSTTRRISSSSSSALVTVPVYVDGDNNNKYIPYFTDLYRTKNLLQETDYKTFFPSANFSDFNVANASVIEKDIPAENGMIHIVDEVITPLQSIDQYISARSQYSDFKALLDSLSFYNANVSLTVRNAQLTGSADSVYVKSYDGRLAFSPNNESYQDPFTTSYTNTGSQRWAYTMFVPTNEALAEYRSKILKKYNNTFFGNTPSSVLVDFINSHMGGEPFWPTHFSTTFNYLGETSTVGMDKVVDKQMLSNGIFYGINKAQEANVFRTLYGIPYLNPDFRMSFYAYSDPSTGIRPTLTQPNVKHAILLMSDAVLSEAGWKYDESKIGSGTTAWGYKAPTATSHAHNSPYRETILRVLKTGVLVTYSETLNIFGKGIAEALNGEYIKYDNGKIQTSGTVDSNVEIRVVETDNTGINGLAYYINAPLTFSEKNIGEHIEKLATEYPSDYASFYWFLSNSNIYNKTTKAVSGVSLGADNNYTVFAPSNAAIAQAIKDGKLPGNKTTGALPATAPTNEVEKDQVRKFLLYHIINGNTVAADGKKSDKFISLLTNENGDSLFMEVLNTPSSTIVVDRLGNPANVKIEVSNQLSSRTLIHSIDNYLKYQQ